MSPAAIVRTAIERAIDIIAITDHNSAENIISAQKAAERKNITVLAGMEITSSEEAHILALLNGTEGIHKLQDMVYKKLQPGENNEKLFGEQVVVNENDEVLAFNKKLLIGATALSAQDIVETIHSLGGLAVASHVDRDAFSIISQLGFIPEDLHFDALEISPNTNKEAAELSFSGYRFLPWVSSSDAHWLRDMGRRTTVFYMHEPKIEEMRLALKSVEGRSVEWE